MKIAPVVLHISLAAMLVAAPVAGIAKSPDAASSTALQILENNVAEPLSVTWDESSTRVESLSGELSPASAEPVLDIAARFLEENAAIFGVPPPFSLELEVDNVFESPAGYHIKYQQMYKGMPVFDGSIEVHLGTNGDVFLINNDYITGIPAGLGADKAQAVSEQNVLESALEHFKKFYVHKGRSGQAQTPSKANKKLQLDQPVPIMTMGVARKQGGFRLAYQFRLEVRRPIAEMEYIVDAIDGSVLSTQDYIIDARVKGKGRVFDPNPVSTLNRHSLRDRGDADQRAFDRAYIRRPLRDISKLRIGNKNYYELSGPYVRVLDSLEAPYLFRNRAPKWRGRYLSRRPIFPVKRQHDYFEGVMVYYHIDNSQRYIQSLGFKRLINYPIRVDPHGLGGKSNSHYRAKVQLKRSFLAFGGGGDNLVDHAEDADVILHEYGHAIQDHSGRKYRGKCKPKPAQHKPYTERSALGEGFSDYWAASSALARNKRNGFDTACMGAWVAKSQSDGSRLSRARNPKRCFRRLDGPDRYPSNPANLAKECHRDGKIWSATLWDLRKVLSQKVGDDNKGRKLTDRMILLSHFLVKSKPKFVDNGDALVLADKRLNDRNRDGVGDNKEEICKVLENRGISPKSCAIKCDSQRHAGGDTAVTVKVDLGQKSGSFDFYYQTYYQRDRILVRYRNRTLFDTGCVGASGTETLHFNGSSKFVSVEVIPNCAGGSGTAWVFQVSCPAP